MDYDPDNLENQKCSHYKLVEYINCYKLHLGSLLNNFSYTTEKNLFTLEKNLQKAEIVLNLLETKLSKIEEINDQQNEKLNTENTLPPTLQAEFSSNISPQQDNDDSTLSEKSIALEEPKKEEIDPLYAKYFRLLKLGVSFEAFEISFRSEGLDVSTFKKLAKIQ